MAILQFIKPTTIIFLKRQHEIGDVYTFTFTLDTELSWHAGQHGLIEIALPNGKTGRHMFSLSSAPSENTVSITTHWYGENKASEYKKALWQLKPGSKAKLRGPVGPMHVRKSAKEHVFIAGGIGITPFRAMIAEATGEDLKLQGTLLYLNRDTTKIVFQDELKQMASSLKNFQIIFIAGSDKITADLIYKSYNNMQDTMFYLAGPPAMVKAYRKLLNELGVKKSQIKNDPFYGYK